MAIPGKAFVSDKSQQVTAIDTNTADIVVRAVRPDDPPAARSRRSEIPPGPRRPSAELVHSKRRSADREMAAKRPATRKTPGARALALERFVNEKITQKNFSQTFATAADVAETPDRRLHRARRAAGGAGPRTRDSEPRGAGTGLRPQRTGVWLSHVDRGLYRRSLDRRRRHTGTREASARDI